MPKAIRVHEYGGPEVMRYEEVTVGEPGPGQIRVRQSAVGVNFIDIYFRSGHYKAPQLPFTPGNEGAGTVVAVGEGVTGFKPGERVAYGSAAGTYAEEVLVDAKQVVRLPDGIDDDTAAAMMLKGLTTQYLLRRTYKVQPGDTILFHAAAGGVGLIATQWAKHLGATVIGTVGSEDKAELARQHGCDHVILYRNEDFAAKVKEITGGKGCQVVYDGVGQATFPASLDCLRPFGYYVNFGSASGAVTQFDISLLAQKGSLYATRPTLFTHTADRAVLDEMAADLFEVVRSGAVKIPVHTRATLAAAPKVHAELAGRQTTGATVMHP
ncbi:NADPH2:quinone reductase [Methylobacterium sp. 174MFSha1.1]|uniref:quinone oxidoreductase family protein n=1 Tax=Methylobacterium sp. 174MFSha1.1 TaxID=1502749 RepID=UPI0008E7ED8C|nr:quinone oxidoreductase [Methylobacterium sp. 174MFSha1.1]SFU78689.1 NADPH2:quinone reductase [Methylobacterium sp. 174MFSha1.1]